MSKREIVSRHHSSSTASIIQACRTQMGHLCEARQRVCTCLNPCEQDYICGQMCVACAHNTRTISVCVYACACVRAPGKVWEGGPGPSEVSMAGCLISWTKSSSLFGQRLNPVSFHSYLEIKSPVQCLELHTRTRTHVRSGPVWMTSKSVQPKELSVTYSVSQKNWQYVLASDRVHLRMCLWPLWPAPL